MAFSKLFGGAGKALLIIAVGCNIYATVKASTHKDEEISAEVKQEATEQIKDAIEGTDFNSQESLEFMGETIATISNDLFGSGSFEEAMVKRVVDGDTIIVNIDGYGDVSVRMIGINTPESVASEEYLERKGTTNSEEGKEASEYTKELLDDVDIVYLQKDTSETDPYNRLLRYVWLEVPDNAFSMEEISDKMVNAILVKEGYAEAVYYAPDGMYSAYFEALEEGYEGRE